jgi:tetratricopeptide (TPR) repeat protein
LPAEILGRIDDVLESRLSPGTRLAGRFQIVRAIGRGGMGIVYEAVDEALNRRVALKCARPGHQSSLPPEARHASEVSHYNICKVHDLHSATTPVGDMRFLSMEFIDGETLSARIRNAGLVDDADALNIAAQICAGLAQAHRQGVIHGDLKTGNVLLAKSTEGGVRAVITDFGLAKPIAGSAGSGGGTLEYMAPELLRGGRSTVASDIYALGVLFHVMRTGRIPERTGTVPQPDTRVSTVTFGDTGVDEVAERRIEPMPPPWSGVVSRCLARDPAKRFQSADEVAAALEPRQISRRTALAVAAAVLFAAGVGYWQTRTPPPGPPVRLAILPFAVEGAAVASAAGIAFDVAERLSGVQSNLTVISPREAQRSGVDSSEEARSALGATHVLETKMRASAGGLVTASTLIDMDSGRILRRLNGTYPPGDAQALSKAILATVTGALRLRDGAPRESVSASAYPEYVLGLELLQQGDNPDAAVPHLQRARDLDPRSALPLAGIAEAQLRKFLRGYGREWLDAATSSLSQAKSLNSDSVPVLVASGLLEQQHGRYEQAIHDLTRATELDGTSSDAWRRLAVVYEKAGRTEEAIATYRKATQAQPNDYRLFLDFGTYYFTRSQFGQSEQLYRRVTTLAPGVPSGHINLGLTLMQQGRFAEAEKSLLNAMRIRKTAVLLLNLGALYYAQERYSEAAALFEESLAAGPPTALAYRNAGDAYRMLDRRNDAAETYRKGRALAEADVARNPRQASSRALLGLLSAFLGERARAEFELSQALAMDSDNSMVLRDGVIAYEYMRSRDKALALIRKAPASLTSDLARQPDLKDLRADARFRQLAGKLMEKQ